MRPHPRPSPLPGFDRTYEELKLRIVSAVAIKPFAVLIVPMRN